MDKVDIAEDMKNHQMNDSEVAIGMEIIKFIESKKEIGASNIELLVLIQTHPIYRSLHK